MSHDLRRIANRRRALGLGALGLALMVALILAVVASPHPYPVSEAWAALWGHGPDGAIFAIRDLRLPRALVAALAGAAFGLGGAAVQTLLRNPLASPDILGISAGASAAAVFAITVLGLSGLPVSALAVASGLAVALAIYLLAWRQGVNGGRLILVGIGLSAMLQSVTAHLLGRAPAWSLAEAMRWLAGSVNGAQLEQAWPLALALGAFGGMLALSARDLQLLRLGDDTAAGLGVRVGATKARVVLAAVGLVTLATAAAGPVAFVAFLAGPITIRLVRGGALAPAALMGALLVLTCDMVGQSLLPARLPVGVVTGLLGAPFLVFLIIRDNKGGRA